MTMQTTAETEVRAEVIVNAPAERAFRAFTERMHDWWPREHRLGGAERIAIVLEPRVGGQWYERTADGATCAWGNVLEWDPPRGITLAWRIGVGFVPERDVQRASRVDVRFVEGGDGRTTVTVVHSGIDRHGDGWPSLRDGVEGPDGWPGIMDAFAGTTRR